MEGGEGGRRRDKDGEDKEREGRSNEEGNKEDGIFLCFLLI